MISGGSNNGMRPSTMQGLNETDWYEYYDLTRLRGWTPSIVGMLGGTARMDSYTPVSNARWTMQSMQGWLQRPTGREPSKAELVDYLNQVADKFGINRDVAYAQIQTESGFDRFDPYASIDAWGAHMRNLLNKYGDNYAVALAAYNQGEPTIDKAIKEGREEWLNKAPKEAQGYVGSILEDAKAVGSFLSDPGNFISEWAGNTFTEFLNSDFVKDVSKRIGLTLLAVLIIAIALLRLKG